MSEWQKNFFIENWSRAFWKRDMNDALLHFEGTRDVLLVGLDSEHGNNKSKNWRPWGAEFAEMNEINYLGLSTVVPNWYLSPWFEDQIKSLKRDGFFDRFSRVIFIGHSMGAYGAMRLSRLVENAHVAAFSPQTTLEIGRADFDQRFEGADRMPWAGDQTDISAMRYDPSKVFVFYDPYVGEDRQHAERLETAGAKLFRTYSSGHGSMAYLRKMGIGDEVMQALCFGDLTTSAFYALARHRRMMPWFQKSLKRYFADRGRTAMVEKLEVAIDHAKQAAEDVRYQPDVKNVP